MSYSLLDLSLIEKILFYEFKFKMKYMSIIDLYILYSEKKFSTKRTSPSGVNFCI